MNETISELMDGELDDEQAARLFSSFKSPEAAQDWGTFHLIGDAMRGNKGVAPDFMERFSARLAAEPTVLAPPRRKPRASPRMIALSVAASVTAAGIVVWAVMHTQSPRQIVDTNIARAPEAVKTVSAVNPYVLAHQEFSPSVAMEGMTPYIRTVSDTREAAGR